MLLKINVHLRLSAVHFSFEVIGFPAGAGEADGGDGCGFLQVGGGFVGIEGIRVEAEFAEQFVDAFVGFGFHGGGK